MKLKYLLRGIKEQFYSLNDKEELKIDIKRGLTNFFITGNALGMFSRRSHLTRKGNNKVGYNTITSAKKSALSMELKSKKKGDNHHYSFYYCVYCGKYHLGRNKSNYKK